MNQGDVETYTWSDVRNFALHGGTNIGTTRKTAAAFGVAKVIAAIKEHNLHGLIIIGGYEAYLTARELSEGGCHVPVVVVPATLSNNIPGTEFTIGADTSLNTVVDSCDRIKTSATGTKRRYFFHL